MLLHALAFVAAAQSSILNVAPIESWNGSSWAGLRLGTLEPDLKKAFKTSKTVVADPASVRVQSDRDWVVTAIFRKQGGKSDMVGIALEGERDRSLMSMRSLQDSLGAPDAFAFPDLRFSDWSLAWWKARGIAAVVMGDSVQKILMGDPAILSGNADRWQRQQTMVRSEMKLLVSGIDYTVVCDPRDRDVEASINSFLNYTARRYLNDYAGRGWEAGGNSNRISLRVEYTNKKERTVRTTATISSSPATASGTSQQRVRTDVEAGLYLADTVQDALARLGDDLQDKMRRPMWESEWRPFYGLVR